MDAQCHSGRPGPTISSKRVWLLAAIGLLALLVVASPVYAWPAFVGQSGRQAEHTASPLRHDTIFYALSWPAGAAYGRDAHISVSGVMTVPPPPWPPAIYYGPLISSAVFIPTPGMTVTAYVTGTACAQAQTQEQDGQVVYKLTVQSETYVPGCGGPGRLVAFQVDGQPMSPAAIWSSGVRYWPLQPNVPPVAADDVASTPEEVPVAIDVLANDTDPDLGDVLSVTLVSVPSHGSAVVSGTDTVIYTPALDYNGLDVFTYTVRDSGGLTDTAQVAITVTFVNDPPDAVDDTVNTPQDMPRVIAVLGNDDDPDLPYGDVLSVAAVGAPANGGTSTDGTLVTYTPAAGFTGLDVFTYTVHDLAGLADTARVSVTVGVTNNPPLAASDVATTTEDTLLVVDVLANDSDPDGDTLVLAWVGAPTYGVAAIQGVSVVYTPALDYNGVDAFSYVASDGALTATARVTLTVTPVNDAPLFTSAPLTTATEGVAYAYDITTSDVDAGDVLTISAPLLPAWLGLVDHGDGTAQLAGTPGSTHVGAHAVSLQVRDAAGLTATQSFTITVTGKGLVSVYLPLVLRAWP